MFTGIVEELAKIQKITSDSILIQCNKVLENTKIGDSIAVNGVCLTVSEKFSDGFSADISQETFKVTAFNSLKSGDFVNLERAMPANGRFNGHIVSAHVDGIAKCVQIKKSGEFYDLKFELSSENSKYAIYKGSITINGISLTIADINENVIDIAIIPHTFENTNLKHLKLGDFVNIEVDMLAKYVEKFLSTRDNRSRVSMDLLRENGFL